MAYNEQCSQNQLDDSTRKARTDCVIDTNMTVKVSVEVFEKCFVYEIIDSTKEVDEPAT